MHAYKPGHHYTLTHIDGDSYQHLKFVNRGHGADEEGTNNQEVLRVLIDRVEFLNDELPWDGNEKILHHLRMALVLHESRHLERLVERGKLNPEEIEVNKDGHYKIKIRNNNEKTNKKVHSRRTQD